MGFLANLNLPHHPIYFDRQPAAQSRTEYSMPKKITRTASFFNKHMNAYTLY